MKYKVSKIEIIKYLSAMAVISILLFAFFIFQNIIQYGDMTREYQNTDIYSSLNPQTYSFNDEEIIKQTFTSTENNFSSFSLKFNPDSFGGGGEITVSLYDSTQEHLIQTWEVNVKDFEIDNYQKFVLDPDLSGVQDKTFVICLQGRGLTDVLYASQNDSLNEGTLFVNEVEQSGDLAIKLETKDNVKITLVYGMVFCIFLGNFLTLLVWLWKKYQILGLQKRLVSFSRINWKHNILVIVSFFVLLLISLGIEMGWSHFARISNNGTAGFNEYRFAFIYVMLILAFLYVYFRKVFSVHTERLFFLTFLIIGALFVISIPAEAELSWDAAIHYWRAVSVSHALDGKANLAESWLYWHSGIGYTLPGEIEDLRIGQQNIQNLYNLGLETAINIPFLREISAVAYIPSAVGLAIGRLLQLPYCITYHLGAFMNMLLYVIVSFFAIKRLKSGKMILVVIAGTPVAFFLAAVYSYDTWITAFFILGTAYFIGCMQDGLVKKLDKWIMLLGFSLACAAKPVYFLAFLLFLLLPKNLFINEKECVNFKKVTISLALTYAAGMVLDLIWMILAFCISWIIISVIQRINSVLEKRQQLIIWPIIIAICLAIGIMGCYYILPNLVGTGDIRGGTEVNAAEQVKFILYHPIKYCKILMKYILTKYLAFNGQLQGLFNTFGYIGESGLQAVSFAFLWIVAFTDKRKEDRWRDYNVTRIVSFIICLLTIILMATALYIDFTPVANITIEGCQIRYVMPLMFMFFACVGSNNVFNRIKEATFNICIIGVSNLLLMMNLWQIVIQNYI